MRVALIGDGVWPGRLRRGLQAAARERGDDCDVTLLRPQELLPWVLGAATVDVVLRVGLRPGATTKRGLAFDAVWALGRARRRWRHEVFYWTGTDVLDSARARSAWTRSRLTAAGARAGHLAAAPWLQDELREVGVPARLAWFPLEDDDPPVVPLPAGGPLRVLSYVPEGRWDFYGGPALLAAARALIPHVRLTVAGRLGPPDGVDAPPNVEFTGWTDRFPQLLDAAHVLVRLVAHDALGATVVEALRRERHVVYSYDVPGTLLVRSGDAPALVDRLRSLAQDQERGRLRPNAQGRAAVARRTFLVDSAVVHGYLQGLLAGERR